MLLKKIAVAGNLPLDGFLSARIWSIICQCLSELHTLVPSNPIHFSIQFFVCRYRHVLTMYIFLAVNVSLWTILCL